MIVFSCGLVFPSAFARMPLSPTTKTQNQTNSMTRGKHVLVNLIQGTSSALARGRTEALVACKPSCQPSWSMSTLLPTLSGLTADSVVQSVQAQMVATDVTDAAATAARSSGSRPTGRKLRFPAHKIEEGASGAGKRTSSSHAIL